VVAPDFLDLQPRSAKPRRTGLTHVLDKGLPLSDVTPMLATAAAYIDVWKLGWGTAYLDPGVDAKVAALHEYEIRACVGGTLLEVAWAQDRVAELLDWAARTGFPCVEVSRGALPMPATEKRELIALAASRFTVLSEVGTKDPAASFSVDEWVDEIAGDLAAGAAWVITEGRESGTVGLYRADGSIRVDAVEVLAGATDVQQLVFEAPRKEQQAWLINRFGAEVNLANIPLNEALGLEALRLGLRADTIGLSTEFCDVGFCDTARRRR
jgi:phosphosulfolactate synthase